MEQKHSYKKMYDLITEAYIKGELNPYQCEACFVGNMCGNQGNWSGVSKNTPLFYGSTGVVDWLKESEQFITRKFNGFYTPEDIAEIEYNFLRVLDDNCPVYGGGLTRIKMIFGSATYGGIGYLYAAFSRKTNPNYENALFLAMESTLNFLKEIHISKGEIIDEIPVFNKRELQTA